MSARQAHGPREDVVAEVRATLADAADPDRAPQMQAYMKSAMPYFGVPMPEVRKRARSVFDQFRIDAPEVWDATVRTMYDEATHREERYAALALSAHRYYRGFATAREALPLYEHLIRIGAWWDLVDEASHRVGAVLRVHPAEVSPLIVSWSVDDDLWIRRSSIICQVGHKQDTDLELLGAVIEPNVSGRDFFIRKAIGWALREVAHVDAAWVHAFIDAHPTLAPLSVREATKHIGPSPAARRPKR